MLQQRTGVARVLRRDQPDRFQHGARARAQIAQVSDRSGDYVQPPLPLNCHYNLRLYLPCGST